MDKILKLVHYNLMEQQLTPNPYKIPAASALVAVALTLIGVRVFDPFNAGVATSTASVLCENLSAAVQVTAVSTSIDGVYTGTGTVKEPAAGQITPTNRIAQAIPRVAVPDHPDIQALV